MYSLRMNKDCVDHFTAKISKDTKKSTGDQKRLTLTRSSVKNNS